MTDHPYNPNVTNCFMHDMRNCPYHDEGPCQHRDKPDSDVVCGRDAAAHSPDVWTPKGRLPMAQYRVSLFLTGDDIGPDLLAWLIERQAAAFGFTARVERVQRFDGGRS